MKDETKTTNHKAKGSSNGYRQRKLAWTLESLLKMLRVTDEVVVMATGACHFLFTFHFSFLEF